MNKLIAVAAAFFALATMSASAGDLIAQGGAGGGASVLVHAAPGGYAAAIIDDVDGGDGGNAYTNFSSPSYAPPSGFGAAFGGNGGSAFVGFSAGNGGIATGVIDTVDGGHGGTGFGSFHQFVPYYGGGKG